MLSHINELKHSYSLDQEFFKNYGISLVQTKDDILSTFEEYKTNSQKFITSGSKLDSETEKLNHFFDETQRLLTKLQKSSSSFHIKDTIFIEALLQVFRERKVETISPVRCMNSIVNLGVSRHANPTISKLVEL